MNDMIITLTFLKEERQIQGSITLDKAWKIEGDMELTPRLIWFMDKVQELNKEFKRRDNDNKYKEK